MSDTVALRRALLTLHRVLLEEQRIHAERFGGRMSSSEVLQAAADDLRFNWLKGLSSLVAALDQAQAEEDAAGVAEAVERARALLDPPDPETAFGARYLRALQESPDVVLAHRDARLALAQADPDR